MSRHNAAQKRLPTGWRRHYAHCSWCGWLDLECESKDDAERRAEQHNNDEKEAA